MPRMYPIARTKGKSSVRRMVFVDTETLPDPSWDGKPNWTEYDAELHKLRLGCATYVEMENGRETSREEFDFYSLQQWWDWLYRHGRPKSTLWIFAHNVGFDSTVLDVWGEVDRARQIIPIRWKETPEGMVEAGTVCVLDDPPTILETVDARGLRYRWIDTLNYWRMSLDALGRSLDVPKLAMPDWTESDSVWFEYCRQDVVVIERAITGLLRWVSEHDLGSMKFTAPSLAMSAFRGRFCPVDILFHDNLEVRRLERRAYYGGQVEIYRWGKHRRRIHQLDVTSLYPSVMRGNLFPYRLEACSNDQVQSTCEPWDMGLCGCADVLIDTEDRSYPKRHEGKTIHPVGRYWTSLCGPELKEAYDSGHCVRFGRWSLYKLAPLFDDYVEYFWNLRRQAKQEGNRLYDLLCKLLLNSLYGKFGQRGAEWTFDPDVKTDQPWRRWQTCDAETGEWTTYHALGYQVRRRVDRGEYDKAFPAVAAWTTAYARQRMRRLRAIAGPCQTYYQAVDALYVTQTGLSNLLSAGEVADKVLGKLQHERSGCPCDFRNINNYTLGRKVVMGSIKPCRTCKGTGEVDGVECEECLGQCVPQTNDAGEYPQLAFEHLASILCRDPLEGVVITKTSKKLKQTYDRGTVDDHGWVSPIRLHED